MFEGLRHRIVKRHGDANIETPADKSQSEFFALGGGNLNAKAAVYALARLVNRFRMLAMLHE